MTTKNPVIEMALIVISYTEEKQCPSLENMAAVVMYNSLVKQSQDPSTSRTAKAINRIAIEMARAGINEGISSDIDLAVRESRIFSTTNPQVLVEKTKTLHRDICAILEDIHARPIKIEMLEE